MTMAMATMEVNNATLEQLSKLLNDMAGAAEEPRQKATVELLEKAIDYPGYPKCLMELIKMPQSPPDLKLKAVLCLKAIVKQWWFRQEGTQETKINDEDREYVRKTIITILCDVHLVVQPSLAKLVSDIADVDFPHNWPSMLPEIVARLGSNDFNAITGVLETTNTVFLRYRGGNLAAVNEELAYISQEFGAPITEFFQKAFSLQQSNSDPKAQRDIVKCLHMCISIFSSLIRRDLTDFFADNLSKWMEPMGALLRLQNPALDSGSDMKPGVLEEMKTDICDIVSVLSEKYSDDFFFTDAQGNNQPYLHKFVEIIWNLLTTTTTLDRKYDVLVSKATAFMVNVAIRNHRPHPFSSADILNTIVRQLIIPNLGLREADIELFEDEPEEYIRQDIEGSDMETRRRSATDLVKAFCDNFEEHRVSESFKSYVMQLLGEYDGDPTNKWMQKDTALFLVIHMSAKTSLTSRGVTKVGNFVDVCAFYQQQIVPELAKNGKGIHDVLLSACVRYAITFRLQLSKDDIVALVPVVTELLGHSSYVVQTYAAIAIDRFFVIKETLTNKLRLTSDDMRPHIQSLLSKLFKCLTTQERQNENMMKALLRVFTVARHEVAPFVPDSLSGMVTLIEMVIKNQQNPGFHYYLFMTISAMVRFSCNDSSVRQQVETRLFPIFQYFVEKDVVEFLPYAFQILSQLLSHQPQGQVGESYQQMIGNINVSTWQRPGMVPGLVRLFKVYIGKMGAQVESKTTEFLGLFQNLLTGRQNVREAFELLNEIVANIKLNDTHIKQVMQLILQQLNPKIRTKALKEGMLDFSCHFAGRFGGEALANVLQGIQPGLFENLVEKVLLPEISEVTPSPFTNNIVVGISKVLTEAPVNQNPRLFSLIVATMLGQKVEDADEDEDVYVDVGTDEYTQSHVNLVFSESAVKRFPQVTSSLKFFAENVLTMVQRNSQLQLEHQAVQKLLAMQQAA